MKKSLAPLSLVCFYIWLGFFGLVAVIPASPAVAQDAPMQAPVNPTIQLQQAVKRLNLWLIESKDAQVWRGSLLLNLLDTQSALGERADLATLSLIESRFSQPNDGLNVPVFQDVRFALKAQIKQLSEMHLRGLANQYDLSSAVNQARGNYRPITIAMLEQQRQRVVNDLEALLQYYRKTMRSRKRADLFYDMQLDQTIEFLNGMEFELPPEVSVGKIGSMISSVQEELVAIEEEIDALPEPPQPDNEPEDESEDEDESKDGPEEDVDQEEEGEADKDDAQEDEAELEINPTVFGPVPDDDEPGLKDLERKKEVVEKRLEALKQQKDEVLELDKPRMTKRLREFRKLREFESNFAEVSKTQSDAYFIAVQTSLEQFVRSYFFGTDDNLQEKFLVKMQDLEDNVLKMQGPDAREASAQLGESISWLEDANQVSPLVTAIRAKYSLPNFYLAVSGKLLSQLGSQTFVQNTPVRQNFKGRLIRGNSRVEGRVGFQLRDDPNQIHLDIGLQGTIAAATYIEQGRLQVFSNTSGCFSAERSLFANVGGLLATQPQINVDVDSKLSGTTSRLKLVNRLAAKAFEESKGEAIENTAADAREQLGSQFSEQTEEAIAAGRSGLSRAQVALTSNARLVPEIYLRSTASQVVMVGKKSSPSALAAQSFPVRSNVPTDVAVRIHESVFSNLFERTFKGKTFTSDELAEQVAGMFGGEAPSALTAPAEDEEDEEDVEEEEDESFSITFANVRPIEFKFENGSLGVAISGRRFSQGNRKINAGLKIGLRFKIKRVDGKLKLVRDGKAELDYVGKKTRKVIAFRSFLNAKLNPEDGDGEDQQISIDLPDNLLPLDQLESLKDNKFARRMTLVQCRSQEGWFYLGWNHTPENFIVQHMVDLPAIWSEAIVSDMNDVYIDSLDPPAVPISGPAEDGPQPDSESQDSQSPSVKGVVSPAFETRTSVPNVLPVLNAPAELR